jgi:hypothetical protein
MGFEDVFADVKFDDATLNLGAADQGGNAGPSPTGNMGQPGDSPTPQADQDAGKDPVTGAEPDKDSVGKSDTGKPLPYDQDPKWKKAREAEKSLQDILQAHGLLNAEELKQALSEGLSLKQVLGDRDAKKLVEDSEYLAKVKQNWDQEKRSKEYENETPEQTIARLEREKEELRRGSEEFRSTVEEREHSKRILEGFKTEIDNVLGVVESDTPLAEAEKALAKLYLGVDNPANMIDIEDRTAVRKMAQESLAKFQTLVLKIKQQAIDDYAAGKSKLSVDTTQKGSDTLKPKAQADQQSTRKPASVDEVFDKAGQEFYEILTKGLEAAH